MLLIKGRNIIAVSDSEAQNTLSELLEAIASNQTTIQEIEDPISLNEIQPMKEIIKAAQEIQEVLNNDLNQEAAVDEVDESVKGNGQKCTRQQRQVKRPKRLTVQDIDTSTNDNAKKSRRKKKATTEKDNETKYDKSSHQVKKSTKDSTKKPTQDKGLNENMTLHNKLQELDVEHQLKSTQDIKGVEIENLQENQYDNYIEIDVPFKIPQTKELCKTNNEFQEPIDKCEELSVTQTPNQEIGYREIETSKEIEELIEKMEIAEDKKAMELIQDFQTIQETLIPFEDKQGVECSIDETKETIEETTQSIEETIQPVEETTLSKAETTRSDEDEVKNFKYTKDTNLKDIPGSVFARFYTEHVSYIGNKRKGEYRCTA